MGVYLKVQVSQLGGTCTLLQITAYYQKLFKYDLLRSDLFLFYNNFYHFTAVLLHCSKNPCLHMTVWNHVSLPLVDFIIPSHQ